MGNLHLQLAIVQVTLLLERAQKTHSLTPDELEFMRSLKAKLLDLSMLQKSRDNQHSGIECIQSGDTNTHFFQFMQTSDGRRNSLEKHTLIVVTFNLFSSLLGLPSIRDLALDWSVLRYAMADLSD